jgi:HEAT repeat protein/beta-lactamase regulating signal transducer with metallopeptidase domain
MSPLPLLALLGGSLTKGSIILVAALAGARLLRHRSAASRYALWAATFAALLLLPALTLSLPTLEPPELGRRGPVEHGVMPLAAPAPMAAADTPMQGVLRTRGTSRDMMTDVMTDVPVERSAIAWQRLGRRAAPWALGVWLLGALGVLAALARDVRRISRVARRAAPLHRGPLFDLAAQVARELGVRQPIRLALTRELAVPVTFGLRRPVVLLPAGARRWSEERRRVVLRHELAHVRRRDYAGHLLIELACAVHWPNPLAWSAARRARLEQEQACDDRVLGLGTMSVEYAQHLLDIARTFAEPAAASRGALAMAAAATLPERMHAILDTGVDHRPAGRRMVLALVAAAFFLGVPTAALHPWTDGRREAELAALLRSPDPLRRREAVWALAARDTRGARDLLERRLHDDDQVTRGIAAWALGKTGDRRSLEPLVAALGDADAHVREMAVLALGNLGDSRAVAAIAPLGADPEHGVRSVMTVALRQIGGDAAAEALARLVATDADPHTRVMAAGALARVESRVRVPALSAALADTSAEVRATAASALEALGDRSAVPVLLAALDREPDPDAREALVEALGATHDPRATAGLVRALSDSLPRLREAAARRLGELADEVAAGPLIAATRDSDHRVRLTAVWALDALERNR